MRGIYAIVVLALAAGCVEPPAERQDELRYFVDHEALKEDFRGTGAFDLRVPGGTITVTGEENDLCGDRCPPERDDVHVLGHVVGYPGSAANILLAEYGVYGSAEVPTAEGDVLAQFNMDETDEGYILRVDLRNGSAPFSALF